MIGKNREKGWTGMVFFFAGSGPRTDRLGNGPYIHLISNELLGMVLILSHAAFLLPVFDVL